MTRAGFWFGTAMRKAGVEGQPEMSFLNED